MKKQSLIWICQIKRMAHKKHRFYLRAHSAKLLIHRNLHKLDCIKNFRMSEWTQKPNIRYINEMRFILDDNSVFIGPDINLCASIRFGRMPNRQENIKNMSLFVFHPWLCPSIYSACISLSFFFYLRLNIRCWFLIIFSARSLHTTHTKKHITNAFYIHAAAKISHKVHTQILCSLFFILSSSNGFFCFHRAQQKSRHREKNNMHFN